MKKTVSLVLGSGGARGYAHIGAIEAIREAGYEISAISGSSMGALVGGLYACGKLDAYRDWVGSFEAMDVLKLVDFSFARSGIIRGDRVFEKIKEIVGEVSIESLDIPFTAVATDIHAQKEVWFQKGDLLEAIRASVAIPSIFTPKEIGGRLYVDGGVMNPMPIMPLFSAGAETMMAVNLNAPEHPGAAVKQEIDESFKHRVVDFLNKHFFTDNDEQLDAIKILNASLEAMQERITRYGLAARTPDVMIDIPRNVCEFYDFHKAEAVIAYGKEQTAKVLGEFEALHE